LAIDWLSSLGVQRGEQEEAIVVHKFFRATHTKSSARVTYVGATVPGRTTMIPPEDSLIRFMADPGRLTLTDDSLVVLSIEFLREPTALEFGAEERAVIGDPCMFCQVSVWNRIGRPEESEEVTRGIVKPGEDIVALLRSL